MSDQPSTSMLDKIKQAARALTEPPEFPKRMNTITILEKLQDRSILRAHYEARKVATSEGPRYEIYAIASVFVTKPRNPPTVGRLNPEGHGPLFTKEETLAKMKYLDSELAKKGRVEKDADHTRHYHGRYNRRPS